MENDLSFEGISEKSMEKLKRQADIAKQSQHNKPIKRHTVTLIPKKKEGPHNGNKNL